MNLNYPSRLLEEAVHEFSALPGIGHKTALRFVLHLLRQDKAALEAFGNTIARLGSDIHYCSICSNICDNELCSVCADRKRDHSTICIVENIRMSWSLKTPSNTGESTMSWGVSFHPWMVLARLISILENWKIG
jgi:recombinational DNA repair protein RecR